MATEVKNLLKGNDFEQAYFLYLHAMDLHYAFCIRMQDTFKGKFLRLTCSMNQNL